MLFQTLDYFVFLAIALVLYWLATFVRPVVGVLVSLAIAVAYFAIAWEGAFLWPIVAILTVDAFRRHHQGDRDQSALSLYFTRPHSARVTLIFVLSCAFYMAAEAQYLWLILFSTCLDFVIGEALFRTSQADSPRLRKALLFVSVAANLTLLFTFKYYNFFAGEFNAFAEAQGWELSAGLVSAVLPVGISFYTFQTLSYTIDIYRGQLEPARDFRTFGAFVAYFPQLIAGPIVRASELLPQLQKRPTLSQEQVSDGLFLIATGLIKKIVIADYLALGIVDRVFVEPEKFTTVEIVVALYAFTMQLYCDFSGYTDVARGSAKLMGLELPKNFDRPYQAQNPAEFWRRWHMTLSRWLRDYLYFPLGGSRKGQGRAYFNLALTMFLVGIWHGSSVDFVAFFWYAILQTVAMVLHRMWHRGAIGRGLFFRQDPNKPVTEEDERAKEEKTSSWLKLVFFVFLNLQFVVFSRILFRAGQEPDPMATAEAMTTRLCSWTFRSLQVTPTIWAILVVTFTLHFIPRRHFDSLMPAFRKVHPLGKGLILAAVGLLLQSVVSAEAVPFQYFQF